MSNRAAKRASVSQLQIPDHPLPKRSLTLVRGLTQAVTGIDWNRCFPTRLIGDVEASVSDMVEVGNFVRMHYPRIYPGENPAFLSQDQSEKRVRFYEQAGDLFVFREQGKNIGIFVGNLLDWNTYYLRSVGIFPEYQGRGVYQAFMVRLLEVLSEAKIARVEGHIAPNNQRNIHIHNKLGFVITGMQQSERWGTLLHFTKFLDSDSNRVFIDQFCGVDYRTKKAG